MTSLWQESLLYSQSSCHTVNVRPPVSGALFSFTLQAVGGAQFLQKLPAEVNEQRGIAWQIENGSAGALQLLEFHTVNGPLHSPVTIEFPTQLFPGLAFVPVASDRTAVVGITASGLVFVLEVANSDSSLHALSSDRLSFIDVSAHWASLGVPTCIASTEDHVVIGGSNGPVLCLPAPWLRENAAMGLGSAAGTAVTPGSSGAKPFELRESSWGLRGLIAGVLQRSQSPSVISAVPVTTADSRGSDTILIVTYDDCTVRGFSMAKHSQTFTDSIDPSAPPAKRPEPVFAAVCPDSTSPGGAILVAQFEARDTLQRTVVAYQLAPTSSGRFAVRHKMALAAPTNATVLAAHAAGDTMWVLIKAAAGSASALLAFSVAAGGQESGSAALLEARSLSGLAGVSTGSADSMMMVGVGDMGVHCGGRSQPKHRASGFTGSPACGAP